MAGARKRSFSCPLPTCEAFPHEAWLAGGSLLGKEINVKFKASTTSFFTAHHAHWLRTGSTDDQNLDLQNDALQAAGCDRIFRDKACGVRANRPGLKRALEDIRAGDTLVVWRLGGRRKRLDPAKRRHVVELYRSGTHTIAEICSLAGISKPTLYAYVAEFSESA